MEQYIVSARKYRPSTFSSVVGQSALTSTLKHAVASGRLAHSYLFCGGRGVGKTSCARIFAKAINCQHLTADGEPCNECDSCREFNSNTSLNIVELDAASNNGVDDIRELIEQVQVAPTSGAKYRVFIIDEVHMLSSQAFNAFLKTLEEPPRHAVFILATTEKHKIIPTILSRCQIYDFNRITVADTVAHLQMVADREGVTAEPAALSLIARKADGAMRDALSIFDQVSASSGGNITFKAAAENLNVLDNTYYNRLLDAFLAGDVLKTWTIYKEIRDAGFDSQFMINGLAEYLRNLMLATDVQTATLIETDEEERRELREKAAKCTPGFLYRAMSLCNDADLNYRTASSKQFLIELTLAKICQSLSPSPNKGSDGEGRLKPINAARRPMPSTTAQGQTPTNQPQAPANHSPAPPQPQQPGRPTTVPAMTPRGMSPGHTMRPAGGGTMLNVPKVSLKRGGGLQQAGAAEQSSQGAPLKSAPGMRNGDYTEFDFTQAWEKFRDEHPKEHILYHAMRAGRPELTGERRYTMHVVNEVQRQTMEEWITPLTQWLRDRLGNDTVTIDVVVKEGGTPLHVLNDRELLGTLMEENPMLKNFVETLELKLS